MMVLGIPLWFILAFVTAIFWGLGYVMDEQLMKQGLSPALLMLLHMLIVLPLYIYAVYKLSDFNQEIGILNKNKILIIYLVTGSVTILGGSMCILYAVQLKSASLASVIEISYPFFIILFSWLLFKDLQVNYWTLLGGAIIFLGTSIILWKS